MNKSALKSFATAARRELLKKIEAKALKLGITENTIKKAQVESSDAIFIDGRQLSKEEKIQRNKLIDRIKQTNFNRVLEEVAYTWFNRFTALRYMEVNDYLPTKVRVLSSVNSGSTEPDMMKEALSLDLDLDKEIVYELKLANKTEELFKYLIIKHCNDLNRYMPFMFETIDDYTEILFPEGLLATDSFIRQMTDTEVIPEDNWSKIEVIGWLYQYYIAEEKDRVIKAKKKYKTEEIPFATQLFTPEWIVRYMVQNTLGRNWIESHPEHRDLLEEWEFYLENPNPDADLEEKLAPYIDKNLRAEDIKCFDPAMGSGHILVYMFDVLYEIYSKCGYMDREIPRLIIENNLYGLDIDDRAYQLACFSVVMKALKYNNRFLRSIERDGLTLNLASIQETNLLDDADIAYIAGEKSGVLFDECKEFVELFHNAKTTGSLIRLDSFNNELIQQRLIEIQEHPPYDLFDQFRNDEIIEVFKNTLKQATIMSMKYDVLVTNPPYIGNRYLNDVASNYLSLNYPDVKSDLFSAFMEYSFFSVKPNGHIGFMTPFVWMFISSYEKIRRNIIDKRNISSLIQLEYSGFDEATVPICTFTLRNYHVDITGEYIKLSDFKGSKNQPIKTLEAVQDATVTFRYSFNLDSANAIPGNPIAYWVSEKVRYIFENSLRLIDLAEPRQGMATTNNNLFLRRWSEVNINSIGFNYSSEDEAEQSNKKWFPYNKGGEFRKWYGNNEFIVNFENRGKTICDYIDNFSNSNVGSNGRVINRKHYFKESITWSFISSSKFGVRYQPKGFIFDVAGSSLFPGDKERVYLLGLLTSKLSFEFLQIQNPTLNFQVGNISNLPVVKTNDEEILLKIEALTIECINISKNDWDSFETSWDFIEPPIIKFREHAPNLEKSYFLWESFAKDQFYRLKSNEEELNRIFIEIYGLKDELSPNVEDSDVTIRNADLQRDIKSFISYAVGCLLGRYSLDEEGIIFAGGEFDHSRYIIFAADKDNILPILPGAYFEDDIVSRFVAFVRVTFGEETLSENLDFVADALGKKNGETAKDTIRRYFMNDFFKDHVQTYKKRPIYWLFTSGKEKAFNCLIYMHRYDKSTLSRIRTDYLHEYQIRLDAEKADLQGIIDGNSTAAEVSKARKALTSLEKKIAEIRAYDELLHHMADMQIEIDLDDGVAVNYGKFKGLVAPI